MPATLAALLILPAAAATAAGTGSLFDGRAGVFAPPSLSAEAVPAVPAAGRIYADETPPPTARVLFPVEGSGWQRVETKGGAPREDAPGAFERVSFMEKARETVCEQIRLPPIAMGGDAVFLERYVHALPLGGLGLIERADLGLPIRPEFKAADLAGNAVLRIGVGLTVRGRSMVVRPLPGESTCAHVKDAFDFRDTKIVLPLKAERFMAMAVGELWKFGVGFETEFRPAVGYDDGVVFAGLQLGYGRSGEPNVSLRRLAEDKLRFRLRVDHAEVVTGGGVAAARLLGGDWGDGLRERLESALGGFIGDKVVFRALRDALTARLSLLASWTWGQEALVEFVLDPRDPAQMKALERVLLGDIGSLGTLREMAKAAGEAWLGGSASPSAAAETARAFAEEFGVLETFAGGAERRGDGLALRLKVPGLIDAGASRGRSRDSVVFADDSGRRFEIHRAQRDAAVKVGDMSFIPYWLDFGSLMEYRSRRSVMSFSRQDKAGSAPPVLIYVQQADFQRQSGHAAERTLESADGVMRLLGTRGRGLNARSALPAALALPQRRDPGKDDLYSDGASAFTVVLNARALAAAQAASPAEIMGAYAHALRDGYQSELAWALANGRLGKNGLSYDEAALARAFGFHGADGRRHEGLDAVRARADEGWRLVLDLKEMALQAGDTRDIAAGRARSGLSYEDALRVLVQFADPADVYAEFTSGLRRSGDAKRPAETYVFNPAAAQSELAAEANRALMRFAKPSKLLD